MNIDGWDVLPQNNSTFPGNNSPKPNIIRPENNPSAIHLKYSFKFQAPIIALHKAPWRVFEFTFGDEIEAELTANCV